jgi:hypothetical protein
LIEEGADPNPALFVAVEEGDVFFSALCNSSKSLDLKTIVAGKSKQTILHRAVITQNASVNVVKPLLKMAQEQMKSGFGDWLNARDYRGFTALHYAAKRRLNDVMTLLLQFGASIFVTDNLDVPAFFDMRPEMIQSYLDSQIQMTDGSVMDDDHGVILDYKFLRDPAEKQQNRSVENGAKNKDEYIVVQGEEGGERKKMYRPEVGPLKLLASSPRHRHLLQHPIIRSFLRLKWHLLYWFYWLNFAFYFAFTCFFTLYLFSFDFDSNSNATMITAERIEPELKGGLNDWLPLFSAATLICTILIALRELMQLLFLGKKYLTKWENWLEMTIIVLMMWLLLATPMEENPNNVLAAILYLLVSLELVLLMGRHPRLAAYISMFFRVSIDFFKFLLWYMCLIFAFGVSFYIVFHKCEGEDCDKHFFRSVPISFFKTLVMISGEYEVGDLNFEHLSVTSHLIFITFLFFISIVMVNLLNGLAVSDTQEIKNEAELLFCISQAKYYSDIENTLLSCENQNCCSFFKWFSSWMGHKITLLDNLLPDNKVTVYLNRDNAMEPDVRFCEGQDDCFCCFCGLKVPYIFRGICNVFNVIIRDAVRAAAKKQDEDLKKQEEEDKQQVLLDRIDDLEKILNKLSAELKTS